MCNQALSEKIILFFDGKHGCVNEFITLTGSINHPLQKSQIILATMDCKHKDTWKVSAIFNNAYKDLLTASTQKTYNAHKRKMEPFIMKNECTDIRG